MGDLGFRMHIGIRNECGFMVLKLILQSNGIKLPGSILVPATTRMDLFWLPAIRVIPAQIRRMKQSRKMIGQWRKRKMEIKK